MFKKKVRVKQVNDFYYPQWRLLGVWLFYTHTSRYDVHTKHCFKTLGEAANFLSTLQGPSVTIHEINFKKGKK